MLCFPLRVHVSDPFRSFLPFCRYDHQERLTAQEAMAHPYFAPIRAAEAATAAGSANQTTK